MMDRVYSIKEHVPENDMDFIAVAIGAVDKNQYHIGILHRQEGKPPELLHLAWHYKLENESALPADFSIWVKLNIPSSRQCSIAALCRRIWKKQNQSGIPYAFSSPEKSINLPTGRYLLGPSRFGLTCASFVLAVFDSAAFPLAEYATWPSDRLEDRQWQEKIIESLKKGASQEHIQHVQDEIGTVRYRPEEVAASAAFVPPAAIFKDAQEVGVKIASKMKQLSNL